MAGVLLQSTIFSSTISSQSNIRSKQYENKKRSVKMMGSLKSSPMRVAAFSGLHGVNALNNIVNNKASRIVPQAMFEDFQETDEDLSESGSKVIKLAHEEARRLGHNFVGTEQILLGIIGEDTGIAARVLKSTGINLKDARDEVEKIIGRGSGFVTEEIPFTPRANRVTELSVEEARQLGHDDIGSEDLLLGLLREGEGVAARVLENFGADPKKIREQVKMASLGEALIAGYKHAFGMQNLEELSANLAKLPEEIQVPESRPQTKKTNSEKIKGKKVKTLDVGLLGELEGGLKKIIKLSDEVILCIDKFQTLIGARTGEGVGDIDAA